MTYTVERLHSCIAEDRQTMFRLTYEVSYIQEIDVWRTFLIGKEELLAPLASPGRGRSSDIGQ